MGLLYLYQSMLHFHYSATIMPSQNIRRQATCTYQRKLMASSHNQPCRGKALRVTYYGCVSVDLVIQNEKRLRRIVLLSVDIRL